MKHNILIIVKSDLNEIFMYDIHTDDDRIADECQTIFQAFRKRREMQDHNLRWHEGGRLHNLLYPILEKFAIVWDQKVIYQPIQYNVIYVME